MENEPAKLETPEEIRAAIGLLASELVSLRDMQTATAQLVQKMDTRIKMLTALTDHDHGVLEKHGMVPPRPKEDPLVN
jgi:hypothetical protein